MDTDTGVTSLLIELIINVALLISFFVALLIAFRWRRRRKEQEAQTTSQSSSTQPEASLPEPEVSELASLPQADELQDDDDEMPAWLNDSD